MRLWARANLPLAGARFFPVIRGTEPGKSNTALGDKTVINVEGWALEA